MKNNPTNALSNPFTFLHSFIPIASARSYVCRPPCKRTNSARVNKLSPQVPSGFRVSRNSVKPKLLLGTRITWKKLTFTLALSFPGVEEKRIVYRTLSFFPIVLISPLHRAINWKLKIMVAEYPANVYIIVSILSRGSRYNLGVNRVNNPIPGCVTRLFASAHYRSPLIPRRVHFTRVHSVPLSRERTNERSGTRWYIACLTNTSAPHTFSAAVLLFEHRH